MQVFGGVLFCLGVMTALLARTIGFELDIFYVIIGISGAGLFLYGAMRKNRHIDESRTKAGAATGDQPSSIRQRVSMRGE